MFRHISILPPIQTPSMFRRKIARWPGYLMFALASSAMISASISTLGSAVAYAQSQPAVGSAPAGQTPQAPPLGQDQALPVPQLGNPAAQGLPPSPTLPALLTL